MIPLILIGVVIAAMASASKSSGGRPAGSPGRSEPTAVTKGSTLERLVLACEYLMEQGKTNAEVKEIMNAKGVGGQDLDLAIESARYNVHARVR